jgi:hypothetical protein
MPYAKLDDSPSWGKVRGNNPTRMAQYLKSGYIQHMNSESRKN